MAFQPALDGDELFVKENVWIYRPCGDMFVKQF